MDKGKDKDKNDGPERNDNRGTLKADATVAGQEITYPTDLKLLSTSRETLERIIDLLYLRPADGTKPRTYRRIARRQYRNIARKKKENKEADSPGNQGAASIHFPRYKNS